MPPRSSRGRAGETGMETPHNRIVVSMSARARWRPLLHDACGATPPPGACPAVSTPPARGPPPPGPCVRAGASPTSGAGAPPSTRGLFCPTRTFRDHNKPWAHIHVRRGCGPPGYWRPAEWALPRAVCVASPPGALAPRMPLHHPHRRHGGRAGAFLLSDAAGGLPPSVRVRTRPTVRSASPSLPRGTRVRAHADALGPGVPAETVRRYPAAPGRRSAQAVTGRGAGVVEATRRVDRPAPVSVEAGAVGGGRWSPHRVSAGMDPKAVTPTPASRAARQAGRWPERPAATIDVQGRRPARRMACHRSPAHGGVGGQVTAGGTRPVSRLAAEASGNHCSGLQSRLSTSAEPCRAA
jgi:hypothetical protein